MIDKNKQNQDKFVWRKGEVKIAKNQCELCEYNNIANPNICIKYPKGKKEEVTNNKILCKQLKKLENNIFNK